MPYSLASMTGFARTEGTVETLTWAWELRAVNGRGLELRFRLPPGWDALEPGYREMAGKVLKRGNVNANLTVRRDTETRPSIDEAALANVMTLAMDLHARIPGSPVPRAESLLTMPGVMRQAPVDPAQERDAAAAAVQAGFAAALDGAGRRPRRRGRASGGGHVARSWMRSPGCATWLRPRPPISPPRTRPA